MTHLKTALGNLEIASNQTPDLASYVSSNPSYGDYKVSASGKGVA
jgi:hypothetical protein